MKTILKILGIITAAILGLLALYAVLGMLFLKGCAMAIHGSPKTESELKKEITSVSKYLEFKYPGHDFEITAENVTRKENNGLPASYDVKISAKDEDGVAFEVYSRKNGYEDDYIDKIESNSSEN